MHARLGACLAGAAWLASQHHIHRFCTVFNTLLDKVKQVKQRAARACQWNAAEGATRRWLLKQPLPSPVMGSHGLVAHSPFTRYLYCAKAHSHVWKALNFGKERRSKIYKVWAW